MPLPLLCCDPRFELTVDIIEPFLEPQGWTLQAYRPLGLQKERLPTKGSLSAPSFPSPSTPLPCVPKPSIDSEREETSAPGSAPLPLGQGDL